MTPEQYAHGLALKLASRFRDPQARAALEAAEDDLVHKVRRQSRLRDLLELVADVSLKLVAVRLAPVRGREGAFYDRGWLRALLEPLTKTPPAQP